MTTKVNIAFPMRYSSEGAFLTNDVTLKAVSDDLKILLLTNYGERVIHYDFGANLRRILFEQGPDMKQQIKDAIASAVNKWMPFLIINNIIVEDNIDNPSLRLNEINVSVNFSVGQLTSSLSVVVRG